MRSIGKGAEAGRMFCGVMNLPQPPTRFSPYGKRILNAAKLVYEIQFKMLRRKLFVKMKKIPEGFELANIVANDTKMVTKVAKLAATLVSKNDANLALPPRFRQVLIESPL
ncbi:hypothetical protein TNCV_5081221 [Trichonephila clavipes]|nr:hypothetical protein TNCV_5081221 [Trichonephila clavipes]